MPEDEKTGKPEEVQIDQQKIVKGASDSESVPGVDEKLPKGTVEAKPPEEPRPGMGARLWSVRAVFATLILFAVGTVWLGIGISEKELLGTVLGAGFLFLGFLSAVFTFVRKSA